MSSAPGETFNYNSGNAQLLSAIITKLTGMSALEYAKVNLFGPQLEPAKDTGVTVWIIVATDVVGYGAIAKTRHSNGRGRIVTASLGISSSVTGACTRPALASPRVEPRD
jgi:CubicO group peptidase (beta-lactamase class C family)